MDPADEATLLSQLQEGEFWVEEEEFLQEFDEVTVGFPITEAGHLQSLYSGKGRPARWGKPVPWGRPARSPWGRPGGVGGGGGGKPHGLCLRKSGLSGARVPLGAPGHQPGYRPQSTSFSAERWFHFLPSLAARGAGRHGAPPYRVPWLVLVSVAGKAAWEPFPGADAWFSV